MKEGSSERKDSDVVIVVDSVELAKKATGVATLQGIDLAAPSLAAGERGAVLTDLGPELFGLREHPAYGSNIIEPDYDALRTALIFFDKFDVPNTTLFKVPWPTYQALEPFGIVQISTSDYVGDPRIAFLRNTFDTFIALDRREPGKWTMSPAVQQLAIPQDELRDHQGFVLEITNALPSFDRSVPLEDILEFKSKHLSEIAALRTYLDDLLLQSSTVGSAAVNDRILINRLTAAISAHNSVMAESKLKQVVVDLKVNVSVPAAVSAVFGFFEEAVRHIPLTSALSHGIGLATVNMVVGHGLKKKSNGPFSYLTKLNRKLF